MHSKKIYVVQPSLPPFEEYVNEIKTLWDTRILTHSGPKHKLLQQQLESFLDVRNVALFANGHLALEIGLGDAKWHWLWVLRWHWHVWVLPPV